MLSFDTSLSNALKVKNTTAFWVLKLYYNDDSTASNFIGVSDINRLDGSDMYHGLVASWGNYTQSLDFFNFTTSTGNMTVKLINTDNSIQGGRFSDLLSSNNFANRKWELFLNTNQAGTFDTAARMIGTGVISGDIQYDINSVSFVLLDKSSVYHKQIPRATVDASTYPSAPEKNINKPVPISYGDFSRNTDDVYYKQFDIKGAFPAIIVNRCDSDGNINALPDSDQAGGRLLNTLSSFNVYMANSGELLNAVESNVTVVSSPTILANNIIKVKGVNYYYRHLLTNSFTSSTRFDGTANIVDNDQTTFQTYNSTDLNEGSGTQVDFLTCVIPTVPKLGELYDNDDIFVILKTSNEQSDDGVGVSVTLNGGTETNPAILSSATNGVRVANFTSKFSSNELSSASLDSTSFSIKNSVATTQGDNSLVYRLLDMWMMIEFRPSQIFTKKVEEEYEKIVGYSVTTQFEQNDSVTEKVTATRTKTLRTPAEIEYLYFSGKGREYGAFIDADSRDNNYNQGNFIKNPIYQIEDILRAELELTSSNIDFTLFDLSGTKESDAGFIGDIFNDAVADIQFAFSQYKFINSKDLIERLCKQCFSWVFISGDGKVNIRTLRRSGDYSASDKTIDYRDINLKSISKTKLNSVRNDITVNYAQDYVQDQFKQTVNVTDSTSAGTTVNGNNQSLKLETDADVIDTTTATAIANAYLHIFKDRKNIITLSTLTPKYNDLEIADIIDFSNWDSSIKIFGTSMTGYWMVTSIAKKINGASITLIQVDTN